MEKRFIPEETTRIEALRQRAVKVRNNAIDGLIELNKLEKELRELSKEEVIQDGEGD
ncbi:hypothetical protein [Paenibacillus sp. Soil787]|uniref:hypothetical protein n=1 Tax=Paenibacillus sp. Soil787 TaxID=1736411 RepID=UPI0012E360F8|nr:hypothetical protein [Paenibacillus sp. Soil787]